MGAETTPSSDPVAQLVAISGAGRRNGDMSRHRGHEDRALTQRSRRSRAHANPGITARVGGTIRAWLHR